MRRSKVMIVPVICLMLLLALWGCAEEESGPVVKDYEDVPQITLSVCTNTPMSDRLWEKDFVAADGTEVKVVEYSSDYYEQEGLTYREMILKRLQSNVDVDCYVIHAEDVIEFAEHNYWMDLSATDAVNSLPADALWQSTYRGEVFSLPMSYVGFGFFWNVDMLTEHGLTIPANLEEFLNVCETLKQAGITPYLANKGYALTVPAMAVGFADLYAADNRETLLEELGSGTTPVSTYMAEGFAFIEMMIDKGYMDPEYALNTAPMDIELADFLAGKGAFICGSPRNMDDAGFEVAITGVPLLKSGAIAVVGASNRMAVNPNSPNVDYAVELLNSVVGAQWPGDPAESGSSQPGGEGAGTDGPILNLTDLVHSENQVPNQDFALSFNTWEVIRDLCREICAGATAEEAAAEYDRIQQEQIAAYSH